MIEQIQNIQREQTEQSNRMTYLEFLLQYPNMMTNQLKQSMRESILTRENIYQIQQWTMKEVGNKLFDSLIDNWDINTSEFNDLIDGKQHLLIVIEVTNQNKFGVYLNQKIVLNENINQWNDGNENDSLFLFDLNGRNEPKKFSFRNRRNRFKLYSINDPNLLSIGNGAIQLFKYQNLDKTLFFSPNVIK